jgi:hypothetical protein
VTNLATSTTRSIDGVLVTRLVKPSGNEVVLTRDDRADCLPVAPPPASRTGSVLWRAAWTQVHPLTVAGAPTDTVWTYVGASPLAYWGALCGWWEDAVRDGCGLGVFEHDVTLRPDIIETFETCSHEWCSFGYEDICCQDMSGWSDEVCERFRQAGSPDGWSPCMDSWADGLGCTKFSAELIAAIPDAPHRIPADNRDWRYMCGGSGVYPVVGLGDILRAGGAKHSWHFPSVEHHHKVQVPDLVE